MAHAHDRRPTHHKSNRQMPCWLVGLHQPSLVYAQRQFLYSSDTPLVAIQLCSISGCKQRLQAEALRCCGPRKLYVSRCHQNHNCLHPRPVFFVGYAPLKEPVALHLYHCVTVTRRSTLTATWYPPAIASRVVGICSVPIVLQTQVVPAAGGNAHTYTVRVAFQGCDASTWMAVERRPLPGTAKRLLHDCCTAHPFPLLHCCMTAARPPLWNRESLRRTRFKVQQQHS
jgi:hypothetical protein